MASEPRQIALGFKYSKFPAKPKERIVLTLPGCCTLNRQSGTPKGNLTAVWRTKKTTLTSWTFLMTHANPATIKLSRQNYQKAISLRQTQSIASHLRTSTDSNPDKMRRPLVPVTSTPSRASCKVRIPHLHVVWPRHQSGQRRKNWSPWIKKWRQQPVTF